MLIALGIYVKRVHHHPEMMTFFHLPAAVFLVLAFYQLSAKNRAAFMAERRRIREQNQEPQLESRAPVV